MPCQDHLSQLWAARDQLRAKGALPIGVAGSAAYQAEWLATDVVPGMTLLLDPDQTLRREVDFGNLTTRQVLFDREGAAAYLRALRRGARQKKITSDTVRSPGLVILDTDLEVRWSHEGRRLGDYPSIPTIMAALDDLAG